MANTKFTTVEATTFTGNLTGDVTGNLTGNVTGNVTGIHILPTPVAYVGAAAGTLAIDPGAGAAIMTKASAGAYTLAAPGAGNVGKTLTIINGYATAHVVTAAGTSLATGNTLTYVNKIGASATLYAISATAWGIIALAGVTQSQVG